MKTFLTILITAAITGGSVWFWQSRPDPSATATHGEREPLFYQSAMHPWIKSEKPGRCTICGMELTPVYPGEKGFDTTGGENIVALTRGQIQATGIATATAEVRPLVHTLRVAGVIDDDATRHRVISAYVDGRIEKLHVNYIGAEVAEGQPLADFYSPAILQSEREYRQLGGDLRTATALRLRQMGLTPEQITDLPGKPLETLSTRILAPMTGTVVAQDIYEGQYVATGTKLFEIADFSTMWFQFLAYESDLPWIKPGDSVSVTTPSRPDKTFEGKITFIDPNFDETTRSTKIRVELPNPLVNGRRELLHKLYADGLVQLAAPDILTIPRSAVIRTGPDSIVYLDRGEGAYAQTTVKTGRRGDELVEILSGLNPGDRVVTQGNLLLDGQAELDRSFTSEAPATSSPSTITLTPAQQAAIRDFIPVADSMAAALAAGDLAAFNKAAGSTMPATTALVSALTNTGIPEQDLAALDKARHIHGITDLKAARKAYLDFSTAATAILQPLRSTPGFPPLKIWQCPMVNEAIPGAPSKARWIQSSTRPIHNPYFGSEMPDCGEEVQP